MLKKFIQWFQGYLQVILVGYSPERFINLCRNRDIQIWNLNRMEDGYIFFISISSFRRLKPIVHKTKTRPRISKRIGFPFYIQKYRKRKILFFSVLMFSVIIYMLSLYVWDVEVTGQYSHTQENIIKYVNSIGTFAGMKKSKVDCKGIEDKIRKKYPDIGWVSAELRGTKLFIKITETNMPVPEIKVTENSHLVASRDGIVTSITTRHGSPCVKAGDVVKKGDILVSGVLEILNDSKEVIKREAVIADADIVIKTYYEYSDSFDLQYIGREYTGDEFNIYGITLFQKKIFFYNLLNKFKSYKKYDIIMDESSLKVNSSFYLPFSHFRKKYAEYKEIQKTYTKEEATQKAKESLIRYLTRLSQQDIEVLKREVKLKITQDQCSLTGKIIVLEPQVEYKTVTNEECTVAQDKEQKEEEN